MPWRINKAIDFRHDSSNGLGAGRGFSDSCVPVEDIISAALSTRHQQSLLIRSRSALNQTRCNLSSRIAPSRGSLA
ncbi:hypothetical protein NC653_030201 [Populus alba x Populus x berolinensis]|uniref:Uncharacterized protein n=1 Tax=Populus alba x Populus x berolinensis TaxID=444605 RepID=A0AAD6Q008_9ROSI|nr:hypothetical protein NC653_030201 [Populus alba x Populus x berolinensis]